MTGLLEGKNEKKRKHKLWLDTETAIVSCTHQQLCISAGGDYREGSVFGSGPDSEDPLPQSYAGPGGEKGRGKGGITAYLCSVVTLKSASYCTMLDVVDLDHSVCTLSRKHRAGTVSFSWVGVEVSEPVGVGGEEIPLLFPRKSSVRFVCLMEETQRRYKRKDEYVVHSVMTAVGNQTERESQRGHRLLQITFICY